MNKYNFTGVLQIALLSYDTSKEEIIKDYNSLLSKEVIETGLNLGSYLKNKEASK